MRQDIKFNTSYLLEYLTFDRIIAGESLRLVYWVGLGLIALFAFASVGASVGIGIKEGLSGILIAFPGVVVGLLISAAMVVIWRAFCEFFGAILRIGEDLHALRQAQERAQDNDIFRR